MSTATKNNAKWKPTKGFFGRNEKWAHESGVVVRHCGHPTANYPYFIEGDIHCRTFSKLKDAQTAALSG